MKNCKTRVQTHNTYRYILVHFGFPLRPSMCILDIECTVSRKFNHRTYIVTKSQSRGSACPSLSNGYLHYLKVYVRHSPWRSMLKSQLSDGKVSYQSWYMNWMVSEWYHKCTPLLKLSISLLIKSFSWTINVIKIQD